MVEVFLQNANSHGIVDRYDENYKASISFPIMKENKSKTNSAIENTFHQSLVNIEEGKRNSNLTKLKTEADRNPCEETNQEILETERKNTSRDNNFNRHDYFLFSEKHQTQQKDKKNPDPPNGSSEDDTKEEQDRNGDKEENNSGYFSLLRTNRNYRLYLLSHFYRHFGDWFVYVSNIIAVSVIRPHKSTALSFLIVTKLVPNILFPTLGGAIADSFDRRQAMICLDFLGALVTLGHIAAIYYNSILILYTVSFSRASISAMYEPVTRAIVPLIVPMQHLKKAAVLNASAWSTMIMVGALVAGHSIPIFGLKFCYIIDTISYTLSMLTMFMVSGSFNTSPMSTKVSFESNIDHEQYCPSLPIVCSRFLRPLFNFTTMFNELRLYLRRCGFGICVIIKASGTLSWGAAAILNNAFAHFEGKGTEADFYRRLGYIYSSGGLGSLLGPIMVANTLEVKDGKTFQLAIIIGLGLQFCGWFGESLFSNYYIVVCAFTALRTSGSATMWIFSSLLFQILVPADILGRVLSFELAMGFLCETIAVVVAGVAKDAGYTNKQVALGQGLVAFFFFSFWAIYYRIGGGKANQILTHEDKRNARIDYFRYNLFV